MKYKNIREEELKNKVAADWFMQFDATGTLHTTSKKPAK